jgi:riboflavin-specific deaminase-like protein
MTERPHVLLNVAVSIDGCIDDTHPDRLLLSNPADFDRVDQVRADSDAILIGAETLRSDNPRLLVKNEKRRAERIARGLSEYPLKIVVTGSGNLDSGLKFWHHGGAKVVYTTDAGAEKLQDRLGSLADIVSLGLEINFSVLLDDLGERGIRKLMVEGGGTIHTAFLSAGLVDEIHMAVAPLVVGQVGAPRFLNPAHYPGNPTRRMRLADAHIIGDIVLLRYLPKFDSTA